MLPYKGTLLFISLLNSQKNLPAVYWITYKGYFSFIILYLRSRSEVLEIAVFMVRFLTSLGLNAEVWSM